MTPPLRLGVVGYGSGGRLFHTPFIEAAEGVELAGVVARAPARVAEARADWPAVEVFGSLAELLDSGVDAVTITTPPGTHLPASARQHKWLFLAFARGGVTRCSGHARDCASCPDSCQSRERVDGSRGA